MTDVLQRLIFAANNNINAPVILPEAYSNIDYVTETLKIFNITPLYYKTNTIKYVSRLHYIPHQSSTGNYNEKLILHLRDIFRNTIKLTTEKNKIYISRKYAPKRKLLNEEKLIEILKKYNFKVYYFEKLSFTKQLEIAANSSVIMSIHGAGLTNMMFMQPGTKVIELRLENDKINNCYFSLASALNIDYYYLKCKGTSSNTWDADFMVDINKLNLLLMDIND